MFFNGLMNLFAEKKTTTKTQKNKQKPLFLAQLNGFLSGSDATSRPQGTAGNHQFAVKTIVFACCFVFVLLFPWRENKQKHKQNINLL